MKENGISGFWEEGEGRGGSVCSWVAERLGPQGKFWDVQEALLSCRIKATSWLSPQGLNALSLCPPARLYSHPFSTTSPPQILQNPSNPSSLGEGATGAEREKGLTAALHFFMTEFFSEAQMVISLRSKCLTRLAIWKEEEKR